MPYGFESISEIAGSVLSVGFFFYIAITLARLQGKVNKFCEGTDQRIARLENIQNGAIISKRKKPAG